MGGEECRGRWERLNGEINEERKWVQKVYHTREAGALSNSASFMGGWFIYDAMEVPR